MFVVYAVYSGTIAAAGTNLIPAEPCTKFVIQNDDGSNELLAKVKCDNGDAFQVTVKAGEQFSEYFSAFKRVELDGSGVAYRAYVCRENV